MALLPSSGAESATWLQLSFLVPVAATVIGWIVVARQADVRARRQEIRDIIDELRERCDRAVDAADIYWSRGKDAGERTSAAIRLKASFPGISRILNSAVAAGLEFEKWSLLVEMRQAATGGDFDRKAGRPRASDRDKILDTSLAAEDLIEAVDGAYFAQFPIKRKRSWMSLFPTMLVFSATRDTPG